MSGVQRFAAKSAAVTVGLLVAASLGGCTSGGSPTPPTTVPVSTAAAPTTTAVQTTTAMTDDEAAIAAAKKYYEEFSQALATLDTRSFRSAVQPGCLVCEEDAAKIDSLRAAGRKIAGGQTSIRDPRVESRTAPGEVVVVGTVTVAAMQVSDATGKIVSSSPAKDVVMRLWLRKGQEKWLVQAVFS